MTSGFYHCSVKPVGRSNGRSIVAAAAYRHGERLADERTGETFDYRARGGVEDSFTMTRDGAAAWGQNRERLWNGAERAEDRANGRLATELELALPCELDAAAHRRLLKDFLAPIIAAHGVAADIAIHAPGKNGDHRNTHAHVLITHREFGPDGFGDIANQRTLTRKRKGREVQEKVAGIAATPADITALRQAWERAVNREYERAGLDIRVDHRSHADRGIKQEPTQHIGPDATAMERKGIATERGNANREITQRNATLEHIAALLAQEAAIKAELASIQHFDRDAANAQWEEKVAAAGIEKDAGAAAQERRQPPERGEGVEKHGGAARGAYADLQPPGTTLDAIHEAASGASFVRGLSERGLKLAFVTAEEARASNFAKAINPELWALREGLAVIDARGNAYRIDRRTTGEHFPKAQAQLARIDTGALPTVAQARAQQREINRAAWREKKQVERDAARPATRIEQTILDAAAAAGNDRQKFTAALDKEGLGLARVTQADVIALDALRKDEALRFAAEPGYQPKYFPQCEAGQLAAVDKHGGVHRLNPQHMAAAGSDPNLPSVEIVRTAFATARRAAVDFQQGMIDVQLDRRADKQRADAVWSDTRDVLRRRDRATAQTKGAARGVINTGERTLFKSASAGAGLAGTIVRLAEKLLSGIFEFGFGASAPPPPQETERKARAAEERHQEAADYAAHADHNERLDDLLRQTAREDAERQRQRRERGDHDEVDRGRERDR